MNIDEQIAALQKQKKEQEKERLVKMDAVKRKYDFTIRQSPASQIRLWDDSMCWYTLIGSIANKDELIAAGYHEEDDKLRGGAMRYLFNAKTEKIVMRDGGGMIFIPEDLFYANKRLESSEINVQDAAQKTFDNLGAFLAVSPEGGNVTRIVTANPFYRW